ncbi:MAG TPA: GNAT family N-acetyltransferase [Polyangiaceae bacterium]
MVEIPTVESERLVLRGHRVDDLEDCAAMWGDPEVTRHISGRSFSREDVWIKLQRHVGHWYLKGFGFWLMNEKASGRFVGEVGFADFKRDIVPSIEGLPEIGWVLTPSAHGKGLATEAARTALAWLETRFGVMRTACLIAPANTRSIRVAQKCGYTESTRTTYKDQPTILMHR